MKKNCNRLIALVVGIALLLAICAVPSFAAGKIEPLKYNTWYHLTGPQEAAIYKVTIKKETLLTVQWRNYNQDDFAYGVFFIDKECKTELDMIEGTFLGVDEPEIGSKCFVLYPGTYYLRMYDNAKKTMVKITSKPADAINKPNYCVSKAITMKNGKTAEYAQTKTNNYPRWYKIKLTKPQTITFYCTYDYIIYFDYDLYDSNFNEIRTSKTDYGFITDGVQAKGVYYLVTENYVSELLKMGRYAALYWR